MALLRNRFFTIFALVCTLQVVDVESTADAADVAEMGATSVTDAQLAKLLATDGKAAELGKDGKKLLYFWATWCPTCRQKLQNGDLAAINGTPGIDVIAVNTDKEAERAASYVAKNKPGVPVARDPEKALLDPLKVQAVPYWVVVERDAAAKNWKVTAAAEGGDLPKMRAALGI